MKINIKTVEIVLAPWIFYWICPDFRKWRVKFNYGGFKMATFWSNDDVKARKKHLTFGLICQIYFINLSFIGMFSNNRRGEVLVWIASI